MAKSRTKKAVFNVVSSIGSEVIKLACGLILPRLILSNFGSAYNGVVSSVSQFIECIALMKAGIGGATKAALYKPLADKDEEEISVVVRTTQVFMRKVALFFVVFVICFSIIYPIFINHEFDFLFTSTLIIVVSISNFVDYFFCYSYQLLLMSDQKEYILTLQNIAATILTTIASVILINNCNSIHIIKLGGALAGIIPQFYMFWYIKKHYKIDKKAKGDMAKLPQRWDAFAHEVATFVNNNTDIMVLTIFSNLVTVSVYTVYHYVISNIKKIIKTSVSNFASAFGDMYAKEEHDLIEENLRIFELIINSMVSIIHSTTMAMIVPFVLIYTSGINDVNYSRPVFAIVAVLASAFDCFRMPYKTIVTAIGHFKQTRNGAFFEAILNITVSCAMVFKFGLIGVAIGTLVAMMFRTIQYGMYLSKVLNRSLKPFICHVLLSLAIIFAVYFVSKLYLPATMDGWLEWIGYSFITVVIAGALTVGTNLLFYRTEFDNLLNKLFKSFRKKNKKIQNA